ncbi:hypothetical protein Gasu2_57660 [Galdieria sulphuraria]|nr:hypothetical protein Gasu2_57660 [Galdieria sulphuraria]
MKFHIEVPLQVSKEEFWKLETVDEGTLEDGTCFRKMHIFPKLEVFEGFKSLKHYVEEHFTGLEDYQWWKEDGSCTQFFCTKPLGLLADKVTTEGRMDLIETGTETCTYVLQGSVQVHLVGIGHLAEPIIIRNMKHFYQGKFCELANEFFTKRNAVSVHQQQLQLFMTKGPSKSRLGNIFRRKSTSSTKMDSDLLPNTTALSDKEEEEEEIGEEGRHSQEDEIKVFA